MFETSGNVFKFKFSLLNASKSNWLSDLLVTFYCKIFPISSSFPSPITDLYSNSWFNGENQKKYIFRCSISDASKLTLMIWLIRTTTCQITLVIPIKMSELKRFYFRKLLTLKLKIIYQTGKSSHSKIATVKTWQQCSVLTVSWCTIYQVKACLELRHKEHKNYP